MEYGLCKMPSELPVVWRKLGRGLRGVFFAYRNLYLVLGGAECVAYTQQDEVCAGPGCGEGVFRFLAPRFPLDAPIVGGLCVRMPHDGY